MTEDLKRLVRHLIPVLVIYAVSKGWIPQAAQQDIIEVGLILASLGFSLIWSKKRDTQPK